MSRNFAVLGKTRSDTSVDPPAEFTSRDDEYAELVRRLFQGHSTVAIIGAGSCVGVPGFCDGIARALSLTGRRVVLVSVHRLLLMNPARVPAGDAFVQGSARNVWHWPSSVGQHIDFFKPQSNANAENWLDSLRRNFDSIVFDCSGVEVTQEVAEIAAMSDAAIIAVEAGQTTKNQILRDQQVLESSGVKLAGCILIDRR